MIIRQQVLLNSTVGCTHERFPKPRTVVHYKYKNEPYEAKERGYAELDLLASLRPYWEMIAVAKVLNILRRNLDDSISQVAMWTKKK